MTNQNRNAQSQHANPIDAFLNQDQEDEISRPESVEEGVFDVNADDLAHRPHDTSEEHSLDDTHETLASSCLETDALAEAAEDATKESE